MELDLLRDEFTDTSTRGILTCRIPLPVLERDDLDWVGLIDDNGLYRAQTVELPWMGGANLADKSAILEGLYPVTLEWSQRNGTQVLMLHNVPGRQLIEGHIANWAWQLLGCFAPGITRDDKGGVTDSRKAFILLREIVRHWLAYGDTVSIDIHSVQGGAASDTGSSLRA